MNKYIELKEKHQKEINEFPIMSAFNLEQFKEGMERLCVTSEVELISIGYGSFIRKTDKEAYIQMIVRMNEEDKAAMKDPEYCYEAMRYELANHEFCIRRDYTDTLETLGLTMDEVEKDPMLLDALRRATKDYLENVRV